MSRFIPILSRFALQGYTSDQDLLRIAQSPIASLVVDVCQAAAATQPLLPPPLFIHHYEERQVSRNRGVPGEFAQTTEHTVVLSTAAGEVAMEVRAKYRDPKTRTFSPTPFYSLHSYNVQLRERGSDKNTLESSKQGYLLRAIKPHLLRESAESAKRRINEREMNGIQYYFTQQVPRFNNNLPYRMDIDTTLLMQALEVVLGHKSPRDVDSASIQQLTMYHSDYLAKVAGRQVHIDATKEKLSYPYWVLSYCGDSGFFLSVVKYIRFDWVDIGEYTEEVMPRRKFRNLEALRAADPALHDELYLQLSMNKGLIKDFNAVDDSELGKLIPRGDFCDKDGHIASWWYSESTNTNPVIYMFEKVA